MAWPTDPLDVRCVFAFNASLSAPPSNWGWKDCTADLRIAEEVNIKVGRSDRAKQPEPNQATFTLNNPNGQYTVDNPAGVNFPNVVENVPGIIAVRQNLNPTFEVDASDWVGTNGTVARSTVRAFSGAGSLLLTATGGFTTASANIVAKIPVRATGAVYVDAWVYSVAGWASTAVAVDWYDGTNTFISTTTSGTFAVPAAAWTYLGAYLGPGPSNAASVVGRVVMSGSPPGSTAMWIDEARTNVPRLCGYVDGWTPQFNNTGSLATVAVSMSGARRRLGRGNPALRSALYRAITTSSVPPSAYWPCEDQKSGIAVSRALSPIAGVPPMVATGASNFAAVTGAPGSDQQPNFGAGGILTGIVPGSVAATSWRVQCLVQVNTITAPNFASPIQWDTADGNSWELLANTVAGGGFGYSDTLGNTFNSNVQIDDGQWHEVRATQTQSGGNIVLNVFLDNVLVINQTFVGTVSRVVKVYSNLAGNVQSIMSGVGHFVVWNNAISTPGLDTVASMRGYLGETAAARFTRLCGEEGVTAATVNNAGKSMALGPQAVKAFLDHLLDCEQADGGMLLEPLDTFGFGYIVRSDLYNLPVALTIDNAQAQLTPPFAPLHDDLQRQNYITVTRQGGASATYIGDTSRGTYKDTPTLVVATDDVLLNIAAWRAHLGSPRGRLRHPSLTVNFTGSPTLAPIFFSSRGMGIRAQVINPPSQLPQGADLLVSGYTEKLGFKQWVISLLGSPYEVWKTFIVGDSVQGRLDTAGSQLTGGPYAQGVTSLSVQTNAGPLWITTANQPTKFPLNIDVNGQLVTVTGITGATSPQTFTVNPTPAALPNGAAVKLYRQAAVAL